MRLAGTVLAATTLLLGGALGGASPGAAVEPGAVEIVGDAVPRSLTGKPGDAGRGRETTFARERGNCPICHVLPAPDASLHGDVGPSLVGVADRLSEGQIRLKLVDGSGRNPSTVMPAYYRVGGLKRVAAAYAGKTVLTAEEIEDVIAFLMTLRADKR